MQQGAGDFNPPGLTAGKGRDAVIEQLANPQAIQYFPPGDQGRARAKAMQILSPLCERWRTHSELMFVWKSGRLPRTRKA